MTPTAKTFALPTYCRRTNGYNKLDEKVINSWCCSVTEGKTKYRIVRISKPFVTGKIKRSKEFKVEWSSKRKYTDSWSLFVTCI